MMASMGGVRRNIFQAALAVLLALASVAISHAAVFDDGNDRKFVKDLREKSPATLTEEEKAILAAANKVGDIGLCSGKRTGNAFLIRHKACPANGAAVVTSAHLLLDTDGTLRCTWEETQEADYMPNSSYFYSVGDRNDKWVVKLVKLSFPPVNWAEIDGKDLSFRSTDDIAVFCLDEDVTSDRMPDGSRRGHLRFGTGQNVDGNLYMLGLAPDFGNFTKTVYQAGCNGHLGENYLYHACDNIEKSSGSLLGTMEKGEIRFRGVHNDGLKKETHLPASDKANPFKLNGGTSSDRIVYGRHPTELAHDLQWWLRDMGCYAGELDGDWGPASRKALAAFGAAAGVTLPGTELSPELLAAVEKAAKEGAKVCP